MKEGSPSTQVINVLNIFYINIEINIAPLYLKFFLLGNIANTIGFDHNYLSNLHSSEYEEEVSERRKLPRDQIRRSFFETLAVETTATNREDFFSTKRFKVKYILLEMEIQQYITIFLMKKSLEGKLLIINFVVWA